MYGDQGASDTLGRRLERFTSVLLRLLQAYAQYPILHCSRSADAAESLTLQVGRLLHPASGAEGTPLENHPSIRPPRRALDRDLHEVETGLIPETSLVASERRRSTRPHDAARVYSAIWGTADRSAVPHARRGR